MSKNNFEKSLLLFSATMILATSTLTSTSVFANNLEAKNETGIVKDEATNKEEDNKEEVSLSNAEKVEESIKHIEKIIADLKDVKSEDLDLKNLNKAMKDLEDLKKDLHKDTEAGLIKVIDEKMAEFKEEKEKFDKKISDLVKEKEAKTKIEKMKKEIEDILKKYKDKEKYSVADTEKINKELVNIKGELKNIDKDATADNKIFVKDIESFITDTEKKIKEYGHEDAKKPEENLKEISVNRFRNFNNVFTTNVEGKIDLNKALHEHIKQEFGPYKRTEISFESETLKPQKDAKSDLWSVDISESRKEWGLHKITIKSSYYVEKESTAFIYFRDTRDPVVTRPIYSINPYITHMDKVKLTDYVIAENKTSAQLDKQMFAQDLRTKKLLKLEDLIELKPNELYKYRIFDIDGKQDWTIEFRHLPKPKEVGAMSFKDVNGRHWAYNDIKDLTANGLINGYKDGTYRPEETMTVNEFISILGKYIANDRTKLRPIELKPFRGSLDKTNWNFLNQQLVFNRLNDKDFKQFNTKNLDRKITREEVAFLIDRTMRIEKVNLVEQKPTDLVRSKYKSSIISLYESGILNGYPNGTFRPKDYLKRGEVAHIMFNVTEAEGMVQIVMPEDVVKPEEDNKPEEKPEEKPETGEKPETNEKPEEKPEEEPTKPNEKPSQGKLTALDVLNVASEEEIQKILNGRNVEDRLTEKIKLKGWTVGVEYDSRIHTKMVYKLHGPKNQYPRQQIVLSKDYMKDYMKNYKN